MASTAKKESERNKLIQEKCQTLLTQMLRDEDNKYCVDCDAKGPRWASWNLGVFLCIRCAGIHRNLGVHISRVKSVNLDTWTPEHVISLQQMGNSRARAVYEAQLPDGFRRPQTDSALESFIRAKYEQKKYLAREWVPPPPPQVDWAKEIDEELEKQKRKKKAAQANSSLGIGILSSSDKKSVNQSVKNVPLPAPLPKPKSASGGDGSPKTNRSVGGTISSSSCSNNTTNDLLGLSSPTKPMQCNLVTVGDNNDAQNDSFSNFLSASPAKGGKTADNNHETNSGDSTKSSLAKDEEDFFNQGSLNTTEKDKSGKLTKDSILALYGTATTNPLHTGHTYGQPQPQPHQNAMFAAGVGGFTGMNPAAAGWNGMMQHAQQAQFMTPPNSASMYNTPVMTAPTAFSTVGGSVGGMAYAPQYGGVPMTGAGIPNAFGQQQMLVSNAAGSIQQGFNMSQANHNLLPSSIGSGAAAAAAAAVQTIPQMANYGLGSMNMTASTQPNQMTAANLNQQFGNLNIGNVWQ